eukprot:1891863-Amphidinium_carterae.1
MDSFGVRVRLDVKSSSALYVVPCSSCRNFQTRFKPKPTDTLLLNGTRGKSRVYWFCSRPSLQLCSLGVLHATTVSQLFWSLDACWKHAGRDCYVMLSKVVMPVACCTNEQVLQTCQQEQIASNG